MSTIAMRWAERQALSGSATLGSLINALAKRADKNGRTWISQATLAAEMHVSQRHVQRWLPIAECLGLLTRQARSRGRGRGRDTDVITLAIGRVVTATRAMIAAARQRVMALRRRASAKPTPASECRVTTRQSDLPTIRTSEHKEGVSALSSTSAVVRGEETRAQRWRTALHATASWLWGRS